MIKESLTLDIKKLHTELKGMDREKFNSCKRDLNVATKEKNQDLLTLANQGLTTCWIIAQKTDTATFVSAIVDREIPPVKLNRQEMELLKGGSGWETFSDRFIKFIQNNSSSAQPSANLAFLALSSESNS